MPVKNRFAELLPEITSVRQDFHENPEIMFETHRTARKVVELLKGYGVDDVTTGIGRTGVVGVIKGRTDTQGRVIGLRADMDALPIQEETGLTYASKTDGAMHACGHDGHMAMLLGAAKYLAETRNFDGTVVVIFQPAEEGGGGGLEMCQDGLMDRWNIQEVYGMHNWPGHATGEFAIRPGPFFAAADQFDLIVEGRGGHAAKPNETVDSVVVAAHCITALQSIVSRNADPIDQVVVSVTSMESSSNAHNIISQSVTMKGTVRTLSEDAREMVQKRMEDICNGICAAYGAKAHFTYHLGYPCMVNHPEQTEFAARVARSVSGDCATADLVMAGEDFAYMLEERPGAYILVGNGDTAALHHPKYAFNDEAMPAGCSWWAEIVEQRMPIE